MKIKDAIKQLQDYTDQDTEIVIGWWFENDFDVPEGVSWSDACEAADGISQSDYQEDMQNAIDELESDDEPESELCDGCGQELAEWACTCDED